MKNSVFLSLIIFFLSPPVQAWNRIVTLNPMVSEWTAEILGKEKSHYPDFMKKVHTVGPYPQLEIENILSLQPDLVIASVEYNRADQIEKLKKLRLNIIVLPRESFHQMKEWVLRLGLILQEEKASQKVVGEWEKLFNELKPVTVKKRAFFEIQFQPLVSVGKDSFLNDAFKLVGFENIFENIPQTYPKISREAVLDKKPDQVFVFEMIKNQEEKEIIKSTWKNSQVHFLSGDDFSRCSLRLLKALRNLK